MKNATKMVNKKAYLPPSFAIGSVELEQSVAAGSANTVPTDAGNNINKEWSVDANESKTIDW